MNAKNSVQIDKLVANTEIYANISSAAEFENKRIIFRDCQNVDYTHLLKRQPSI